MNPAELHRVLASGPVLADGGMGTSLIATGVPLEACFEEFNTQDPARVEAVHRGFVEAGARMVLTNTFGGNRFRLDRHGAGDRVRAYNRDAVDIARRSGAEFVAGSAGPLGVRLSPYGRVRPEEAFDAYSQAVMRVAERLSPSVASLRARGGGGSAVAITPDGFLLTSAHVVQRSRRVRASFTDERIG